MCQCAEALQRLLQSKRLHLVPQGRLSVSRPVLFLGLAQAQMYTHLELSAIKCNSCMLRVLTTTLLMLNVECTC